MTSTVSYANIAKGKGAEAPEIQKETKVQSETPDSNTPIQDKDTKEEVKTKKTLAPAPVPEKSAWGSAASTASANYSKGVDEHKWPTPDKASSGEHNSNQGQKQQKFINSVTHKWVPITPKVVMPNPKTSNQKNYKNKKSKKTTNRKRKQNNGPKQGNQTKSSAGTNESAQSAQSDSKTAQGEAASSQSSKDASKPVHSVSGENSFRDAENKNKNVLPAGAAHNKGKSAGLNTGANAKQKSSNNSQQFGRQQQQFYQYPQQPNNKYPTQNGFFQPQPYYQGPGFQGNNRVGKSNNFRANGARFPQPGYPNGMMNYPPHYFVPQIPLPISPNQDPQQALTQQIDYYFSLDNLIKDIFLRKNMNADGWVPLSLILNFKRVKIIISGLQNSLEEEEVKPGVIFESLRGCTNLEVNCANGKDLSNSEIEDVGVRVKGNHEQWLLPNES